MSSHTKRNMLNKMSKKVTQPSQKIQQSDLKNQYNVIRKDLLKLREDLQKGYDMAKGIDKKQFINQILKTK